VCTIKGKKEGKRKRNKGEKEKEKKAIQSTFNIGKSLTAITPMIFVCTQSRKKRKNKKKRR